MIFISHSSKDKAAALDVQRRLLGYGYDASQLFLDSDAETGIPSGSKWKQELYARLKDCGALIVLCSANWQESRWCFAELVFAEAMGKEIFPLLLEECSIDQVVAEHQAVFVYKEGGAAYARLWDALDSRHLGPRDDFGWPPKDGDHCPFPGLPAFDERLAGVYFGREVETQTVLEDLRKMRANGEPRLLMIVGGSGSGKSSLLKAGVLPRLKHKTADTEWVVLPTLRYGEQAKEQRTVFDQLAVNVAELFSKGAKSTPDWKLLRTELISDNVKQAVKVFLETSQDLTLARNCSNATVLIAIDQFEELLTPSAGPIAAQFLRFLKELLSCPNGQLLVIGTMRSDHLDIYEKSSAALQAPFFQPWRLGPFPPDRIEQVIRQPANRAKLHITDGLVERLKRDTPTAEALPLLAFTLEKLYRRYESREKIDVQDYESLGGMEGSIQTCIERIVPPTSLSESEGAALRLTFVKHLAQVNDKGEVVRLRARWDDLPTAAKPVLEKFVNERLLIRYESTTKDKLDRRSVSIEVAHEAMFRCWSDLKEWLRTSADILRWRRDVRRDQANDAKWNGLRSVQLAVARDWPRKRRDELTADEQDWVKEGILRERIRLGTVATVVFVVTLLAGIAWWQRNQANDATLAAQRALTASFFRTIGVSMGPIPNLDEREALWELAQLDRANATVRGNLLNRWFRTEVAFRRVDLRGGQGFRAATGLNFEYHRLAVTNAAELGHSLAVALLNTQDSVSLSRLKDALVALANEFEPPAAAEIAKNLAAALLNTQDSNRLSYLKDALPALANKLEPPAAAEIERNLAAALVNSQDSNRLSYLNDALVVLANKLEPQAAAEIARSLAAALVNSRDSYRLSYLGNALAALVNKIEPPAAEEIAEGLAAALVNSQDSYRLSYLSNALAALANNMERPAVAKIARSLAAALVNSQDANRLSYLSNALAALANNMDRPAAAEIARSLAAALMNSQDANRPSYLSNALSALANKLERQAAAEIANSLAAALVNSQDANRLSYLRSAADKMDPEAAAKTAEQEAQDAAASFVNPQEQSYPPANYWRLKMYHDKLAALAQNIEPQAAAEIAKKLAAALANPRIISSDHLGNISDALAALANKMEPKAAADVAKSLAADLLNTQDSNEYLNTEDSNRLSRLKEALVALANKMEPQAAAEIAKSLAAALVNPHIISADHLRSVGDALAALANKIEPPAAVESAKSLVADLLNTQDAYRLSYLSDALAALANKMEPAAAAEMEKGLVPELLDKWQRSWEGKWVFDSLDKTLQALAQNIEPQVAAKIAKSLADLLVDRQTSFDSIYKNCETLAALAQNIEPPAAAEIAKSLATRLEDPEERDSPRLMSLGNALAALASKMTEPKVAAELARRLAKALEKPQQAESERLLVLGKPLAVLCVLFPSTYQTHLLALSNTLLRVSGEADKGKEQLDDRKLLTIVCGQLRPQDLAELLKFPFSTGEAEKIILKQLEAKTGRQFDGNVWKFSEQADALGIKEIDSPAKRPSASDALKELDAL